MKCIDSKDPNGNPDAKAAEKPKASGTKSAAKKAEEKSKE